MLAALNTVANPVFDWHALAPDVILVVTIAAVLVADLIVPDRDAWQSSRIASIGVLAGGYWSDCVAAIPGLIRLQRVQEWYDHALPSPPPRREKIDD